MNFSPVRIPVKYRYENLLAEGVTFFRLSTGEGVCFTVDGGKAFLIGASDSARSWNEWAPFQKFPEKSNPGVVRIGKELLLISMQPFNKISRDGTTPDVKGNVWRSRDNGDTWVRGESIPFKREGTTGVHIVTDRVLATSAGCIVLPVDYTLGREGDDPDQIGTIVSSDCGRTWKRSPIFGPPSGYADRPEGFGEPAVVELGDGRLWMVFRTCLGHLWQAFSRDGGETWGEPTSTGLVSPAAPANAKRIPGTDSVLLVWCCVKPGASIVWTDEPNAWTPRSPLCWAVSHDNCKTWSRPVIIDEGKSAIYPSIHFTDNEVLIFYYWLRDAACEKGGINLTVYDLTTILQQHPYRSGTFQ